MKSFLDNFIDEEINIKRSNAKKLAKKFPELKGKSYTEFLEAIYENGLELDFITSNEMYEELNKPKEAYERNNPRRPSTLTRKSKASHRRA